MYFIFIWYFSSISILFRNYPFFSEPYSGGVLYRHLNNVLTGVGEPFINFKISADFKRDCVYFWCHFCMIRILFISLFTLKFGSRHRWRVIFIIGLKSSCSFDECKGLPVVLVRLKNIVFIVYFLPYLPPDFLSLVSMETGSWLTSVKLGQGFVTLLTLYHFLSSSGVESFPRQLQFDCCCSVTQLELQRASQAPFIFPLEGALQSNHKGGRWLWI